MTSLVVAVVAGGPSVEASVSRASAAGVAQALRDAGHHPEVIELSPALPSRLTAGRYDVVFPAIHGAVGEDGCLQGLLEVIGLPYVGSGVLASALGMSKPHAKVHFRQAGLPVARDTLVTRAESPEAGARRVRSELGPAVVVKPGAGGSAIGVEIVAADADDTALAAALARALALDPTVLVEELLRGKEVTCAVLEDGPSAARALPPTLILPQAAGWYDFQSKYASGGSVHQCPPPFDPGLVARIRAAAVTAHEALGCRDLSRVDFVVDDEHAGFAVLEVNTLPGMTATSLFPEAAAAAGIPFARLCDGLVRRAAERGHRVAPAAIPMPG